jgi:dephospho-CoA kinase
MVVGLTGSMGSGKSTAAALFRRYGATVVDADALVAEALTTPPVRRAARRLFGPGAVLPEGGLDRALIARKFFRSPSLRKKWEGLLHPWVRRRLRRAVRRHRRGVLVLDVPLLFETGMDDLADKTVVVWAPQKKCLSRLLRRGVPRAEALRRLHAQMPPREKSRRADHVVDNSSSRRRLASQVRRLIRTLHPNSAVSV